MATQTTQLPPAQGPQAAVESALSAAEAPLSLQSSCPYEGSLDTDRDELHRDTLRLRKVLRRVYALAAALRDALYRLDPGGEFGAAAEGVVRVVREGLEG